MVARGGPGGIAVDVCRACEGTWFDQGELGRAVREAQDDVTKRRFSTPDRDTSAELRCPHCRKTMNRQSFARTGVIIDLCPTHGVFLDAGELERIAAALDDEPALPMSTKGHQARVESSGARSLDGPASSESLELARKPPKKVVGPKSFEPPPHVSGGGRDLGAVDRASAIWHASRARQERQSRRAQRTRGFFDSDDRTDVVDTIVTLYRIFR
ncbi:MAG: zf-TFIIB domain-containing protein [Deltaproteobacteria bacterium]|nr:zf-TFIIB domain-containing protein [Deltaproteobacteria bacterium]